MSIDSIREELARALRGSHGGARRTLLMCVALAACDEGADVARARRAVLATTLATVAVPDSGTWSDAESRSRWVSSVERGRIRLITERISLHGPFVGERRYHFDSTGFLRHFSEDVARPGREGAPDTSDAAHRVSWIEFATGVPVLSARSFGSQYLRYDRREARRIEQRAYALYDMAARGKRQR